ncbi:protein of unknown function [Bartonella clarridgeiae 73]|uniref:Uncharacterized protein n=1 Tax=Bartonella clarridgeiae (strain CCUG 45776 / CIP 104772 / 73) TaxID=696125 RepID=E6YI41_BARC7|nr:hypothetical protein [Bartonella clarridgeiae]WCR54899.1 MAG: hypothetical protein PG977_000292 [Bartonella clarridgeiae]CBI76529.1 protein of unknown function [Bartonella clarridgeiae 73]
MQTLFLFTSSDPNQIDYINFMIMSVLGAADIKKLEDYSIIFYIESL